jgi:16S rRNA processing protein RimM
VPFADEFVPTVEMEAGRLVVRPPEYIEALPEEKAAEEGAPGSEEKAPEGEDR